MATESTEEHGKILIAKKSLLIFLPVYRPGGEGNLFYLFVFFRGFRGKRFFRITFPFAPVAKNELIVESGG